MRNFFDLCRDCDHRKPMEEDDCDIRQDFRIVASRHGIHVWRIGRCAEFRQIDWSKVRLHSDG